jgi:Ca2+-binding RTX toxin-like protein
MVAPGRQEDVAMAFVYGTSKSETLNALDGVTNGPDKIFALAGNDSIYGLGGDDEIIGGAGADYINGGAGTDTAIYVDSGVGVFVSLLRGQGHYGTAEGDTLVDVENLTGSPYRDLLEGNDGANVLSGGAEYDRIYGFGGADILSGGTGGDHVYGMDGNDILRGDGGADMLRGDAGSDTFQWMSTADTGLDINTADVIADFNFAEGDRIDLSLMDADGNAAGNQAFRFIGTAPFSGTPGEINYAFVDGQTVIQLQTGIDADVEGIIRLNGFFTPEASWFVL